MANLRDQQIKEAQKCQPLLSECRTHLDRAMYWMGTTDDDLYKKLKECYDLICQAYDKL